MRASEQTQQFHDAAISRDAEALRVQYGAIPHRSTKAKLTVAALAFVAATVVAVVLLL